MTASVDRHAGRATWRRLVLLVPTVATTLVAGWLMAEIIGLHEGDLLEIALLTVFVIVFGWIALSFWVAVIGFLLQCLGLHPVTLQRTAPSAGAVPDLARRTALLMPIYNEDPLQAFGRVVATYRSLEATGALASFDFFVLSDTTDETVAQRELLTWLSLRESLAAETRLFYRRRPLNTGRKAGNIGDWLDIHGARYDHMVVLDADSVMSGDTIVRLAALMEANPRTGIIQTLALAVGRETFFARAQQFSNRLYGPLLATGHSFWQLGDANYYGHNAIIRTAAFAAHCRLPVLTGAAPLGGEILSHDFVEAAFIRRGGWHVWLLPELGGSFEQVPSNLLDYAARDRRWVQGNLQHGRLIGTRGLRGLSRLHLGMGIASYAMSPLWLLLLLLSGMAAIRQQWATHAYFGAEKALFPLWPHHRETEIIVLLALTVFILLGPKLLVLGPSLLSGRAARAFGGRMALLLSATVELVYSMLIAPALMLFHTEFIAKILAGRAVGWPAQSRLERGIGWRVAAQRHAGHSVIGLCVIGLLAALAPGYLPWVGTVLAGLLLAIPTTVLSSRWGFGLAARARNLFLIPEEDSVPHELRTLQAARPNRREVPAMRGQPSLIEEPSAAR